MPTVAWGRPSGADVLLPWADNCLLSGTRIVNAGQPDDDIALAWQEFTPDADTVALWHMNEAAWNGTAGEVIDATGNGNDGTALNGANTIANGWFDRCGSFDGSDDWVRCGQGCELFGDCTVEAWIHWLNVTTAYRRQIVTKYSAEGAFMYSLEIHHGAGDKLRFSVRPASSAYVFSTIAVPDNQWVHVAGVREGNQLRVYINGTCYGTADVTPDLVASAGYVGIGLNPRYFNQPFDGYIDDVRLSSVARYTGDFSPHRYESGTVTARHELGQQHALTSIDWGGVFGAEYGLLTKVEVNTVGGWVTVAEDPGGLAPPISGLSHRVSGPHILRVTMAPKSDALQSETPVLDWLQVVLQPVTAAPTRCLVQASLARKAVMAEAGSRLDASLARHELFTRSN